MSVSMWVWMFFCGLLVTPASVGRIAAVYRVDHARVLVGVGVFFVLLAFRLSYVNNRKCEGFRSFFPRVHIVRAQLRLSVITIDVMCEMPVTPVPNPNFASPCVSRRSGRTKSCWISRAW